MTESEILQNILEYDPFRGAADRATPMLSPLQNIAAQMHNLSSDQMKRLSTSNKDPKKREVSLQLRGISTGTKVDPSVASLRVGIHQDVQGVERPENVTSLAQSGYVHQYSDEMSREPHGKELAARHLRAISDRQKSGAKLNTREMRRLKLQGDPSMVKPFMVGEESDPEFANYIARTTNPERNAAIEPDQDLLKHREKRARRLGARVLNQLRDIAPKVGTVVARQKDNPSELNAYDVMDKADRAAILMGQSGRLFRLGQHLHDDDPAKSTLMNMSRTADKTFVAGLQQGKHKYREHGE